MSHMQPDYEDDSEIEEELSEFSGSENSDDPQEAEDEFDSLIAPQLIQPIQIDQNLLSHPIFNNSNDFFLKTLGQILRPLLTADPYTENLPQKLEQFRFFLFQSIFGNQSIANIKGAFQKLGLSEKTTCGKVLSAKTGVAFRCLDCEPPDNGSGLTSIMCAECFEKSNHEGHRVYVEKLTKANTAFCDCGDSETLKPEGFCPEHTRNQVERDEELNKFPQDLLKNCQDCLRKAFYGGMCIFEVAEKLPLGACRNAFVSFGRKFMDQVLGFAQNGYTEINNSFILVLSSLLESKFQAPFNQVWHDCDSLTPEGSVTGEIPNAHSCKCTLTSALLRYAPFIETEVQSRLKKVLMECIQDQKYKEFMTQELVKYVKFLFPSNYIRDDVPHPENSHLVTLNFILCGTESLALKVIESPYFKHYMEIIQSTIQNYEKGNAKLEKAAYYFEDLMNWFINPAYKSVSERIMCHSTFTKDLLGVLATFENKYLYKDQINLNTQDFQINHRQIIKSFDVQSRLFKGIIHNLKYIIQCSEEKKQILFQNVAREWYKSFQTLETQEQAINLNLSLERILSFVLRSYQGEVTQSGIETFFKTFLPEVELESLSSQILKNVQKALGIFRFITILRDPEWAHLGKGYYFFHYLYLEMDIAISQMMILLASPDHLFETLTQNFFSYNQDLVDFCKNPCVKGEDFKNKEAVLKDFLQLLVYFMTDELCLLNLNSRLASQEQIDSDPHRERIVEKAVVNLLLGSYWTDIFFIKDNLANKLLSNDSRVNKIIQKVTILNEKDRKIRVKDEYESELDPYIFAKAPLLQSEMINEYASRAQKNPKLDLVGGKSYDDLQSYLATIQQKLFQSSLPKFLSQLILNASKEIYPLIPLALKLVLMNLESRQGVEENYLTNGFIEKLQELSKIEDLSECKLILQKIQERLKSGDDLKNQIIPQGDSTVDLKKKAAQEKMNKIKEEFAKKQALFADKNKEESPITSSPEKSTTKEDIICQHCLAKVDENNETYGIPIYIGFSNNLFDTKKTEDAFKKFDSNDLSKANWWPVLSSCHHYYHEKCFNVMCEGLTDDPTLFGGLTRFYCCSLCKNLCNHLLLINSGSQESKPAVQAIRERHAALTATLVDLPGFTAPDLSCRFLFNRTHQYFVETFHLQSQPEALEKAFELYTALFKSLKTSLEPLEEPLNFLDKTLLLKLIYSHIKYHPTSPANLATLYTFMHYKLDNILGFIYSNALMDSVQADLQSSLNFLKQYLQIRSIQTVIESQQQGPLTLTQCLALLKDDASLIHQISKEFLFPIQKTILAIALIQPSSVKISKLCNLLCNPQETPEYITQLFQSINISQTFEDFINGAVLELEEAISDPEFLRLDALLAKLGPQQMKRSHVFKLAPRHLELPETFLGFNNKYQCQKCSICHHFSSNKQMVVCLICGQIMCSGACFGHESKQKKISGNANKHANEYHLGSSVFQSIFDNVWIFIDAPLNIASIPKDVYIDAIGQPILDILEESSQIEKLNFKEYQLNENFSDELKRIVNHHEFNKEVRRVILDIEDPNDQAEAILGDLGSY